MNTPVKRAKYIAFGKSVIPSRGPTKHRKGPVPPKRIENGLSGAEKDFI